MSDTQNYTQYIKSKCSTNILQDKQRLVEQYILYMLNRVQQMFKYKNLPDSIPKRQLELITQVDGYSIFIEHEGKYYVVSGRAGGAPNPYYEPTIVPVANPALKLAQQYQINYDYYVNEIASQYPKAVLIRNDSCKLGLMPMFNRYANLMAECDISLRFATINARVPSMVYADNDATKRDAQAIFKQIEEGKNIGIVGGNSFFEGLKVYDYASKETGIKPLLELTQYIRAQWYNELGIQANYNMKREAINAAEAALNDDTLIPLIQDMLECRKEAINEINSLFGLNIEVELDTVWEEVQEEVDNAIELQEATIEKTKAEADKAAAEAETIPEEIKEDNEEIKEEPVEEEKNEEVKGND